MRKIKKINGYLIVKFNAREMQKMEQLGAYGVIDAELYTGHIEIDLGEMEYEDAETLEIAIEQARSLKAEFDVDDLSSEINQKTEQHELSGFIAALCESGICDSDRSPVNLKHFEPIKLSDTASTVDYLKRKLEMETHNLLCCSANYGMTKPRKGYEAEWQKTQRDCKLVEELIQSIEQRVRKKPPIMQAALHCINFKEATPDSCSCEHTRQNPAHHKQPPLFECPTNLGVIEKTFLRMKTALKEAYPNLMIPEDED